MTFYSQTTACAIFMQPKHFLFCFFLQNMVLQIAHGVQMEMFLKLKVSAYFLGAKLLYNWLCLSVWTPLAFLYMTIVHIIHNNSLTFLGIHPLLKRVTHNPAPTMVPPTVKPLYFEKCPHWPTLKILDFS